MTERKRSYRRRVTCTECNREIDSDYKDRHIKNQHGGKNVKFLENDLEESQPKLTFSVSQSPIAFCFGIVNIANNTRSL